MQVEYDNNFIDVKRGTTIKKLLKNEIDKSKEKVIACKFNNEIKDLDYKIYKGGKIELITKK